MTKIIPAKIIEIITKRYGKPKVVYIYKYAELIKILYYSLYKKVYIVEKTYKTIDLTLYEIILSIVEEKYNRIYLKNVLINNKYRVEIMCTYYITSRKLSKVIVLYYNVKTCSYEYVIIYEFFD